MSTSKTPVQQIYPFGPSGDSKCVRCDFTTDGGGWTLIQRRSSGPKFEFYNNWTDYESGFGSCLGNYWIGLSTIHALTSQKNQELRIELEDWEGNKAYAQYSQFSISGPSDDYTLSIGGYMGTAGDSLGYRNGLKFSTKDRDNDVASSLHCAQDRHGAWWYESCTYSNLNGLYRLKGEEYYPYDDAITWYTFTKGYISLKKSDENPINLLANAAEIP